MTDGFPNKPRILRGAFVEFGPSLPPLFVVFQFNPVQLTRNRGMSFTFPGAPKIDPTSAAPSRTLRNFHGEPTSGNLLALQKEQLVTVQEQTIGFEIRLDATDELDERGAIAEQFGIAPQISTLELMTLPKEESLLGAEQGFSFTGGANPPLVLFIFGRKRVLPVNINSLNITETQFSTDLYPIRATVAVSLTVIEGSSGPYLSSKAMTEAMSVLNLANIADVADVTDVADIVVPG